MSSHRSCFACRKVRGFLKDNECDEIVQVGGDRPAILLSKMRVEGEPPDALGSFITQDLSYMMTISD